MILDTFVSIFKADAKELEQAHKDIEKLTDEIVDGMKDAEKQSKKTTEAIVSKLKKLASNTIRNSASTRNEQNVGIGEITINTQATDASGIAVDIGSSLKEQLEALI